MSADVWFQAVPGGMAVWCGTTKIGTARKRGMRYLAVTPDERVLGTFDSLSKAASQLDLEAAKRNPKK